MKELKTKPFNGKVKPSLYEDLHRITYMRQEKINQLLEKWIETYISQHKSDLQRWNEVFGGEKNGNR